MIFNVNTLSGPRAIDIVLPDKPYGVFVSGGVDSSVLLCLIMITRMAEGNKVPLTAFNIMRGAGTEKFSESMMMWINKMFYSDIQLEHVALPYGTPHYDCLRVPGLGLLNSRRVHFMFSGCTSNPPSLENHEQAPTRAALDTQHTNPRWRLPFLHCYKDHIVQLMYDRNLQFIRDVSHTCFAQEEYRCGKCFQCMERAWAFENVGQVDYGKH